MALKEARFLKYLVGGIFLIAAIIFLSTNSLILGRGAHRWGHDETDKLAFAVAASVVPWVIATLTVVLGVTFRKVRLGTREFGIPTVETAVVASMWVMLIIYNLSTGAGVIAGVRQEVIADRQHDAETTRATQARREVLRKQLDGVPQHRPAATVEADISKAKFTRAYTNSDNCKDAQSRDQRSVCSQISQLEGEFAAAQSADQIVQKIIELDAALAAAKPVVAIADAQTELLHDLSGLDRTKLTLWLSASTPVMLELGGAFALHWAFAAFGVSLRLQHDNDNPEPPPSRKVQSEPEPVRNPAPLMSPERAMRAHSNDKLSNQARILDSFFKSYTRALASFEMREEEFFDLYTEISRRQNEDPVSIETFRRAARRAGAVLVEVEGRMSYRELAPIIPAEVKQ